VSGGIHDGYKDGRTIHSRVLSITTTTRRFLANVNSPFAVACPSVVYRLCVCLSSVTFVRRTQAVQIFGNISTALGSWAIHWHPRNISRRSSQGNPSAGRVKHKRGRQV